MNFTYKEVWVWCLATMEHGFPCGSAGKESTHNVGDLGSIPGLGRSPVFLPGKAHGQRSLAGYSLWGHKELDTTEQLSTA